MAKYIKQEMIDLSGKGEEKIYYRLQTERNIDFNELAQEIESRHGIMNREFVKNANRHCKLERAGESRLYHSPYTKDERLKLALQYLEKHGAMRVVEYMNLTKLSRTKATLELKEFRQDASSGITYIGRGSAKVYVKA